METCFTLSPPRGREAGYMSQFKANDELSPSRPYRTLCGKHKPHFMLNRYLKSVAQRVGFLTTVLSHWFSVHHDVYLCVILS